MACEQFRLPGCYARAPPTEFGWLRPACNLSVVTPARQCAMEAINVVLGEDCEMPLGHLITPASTDSPPVRPLPQMGEHPALPP
jgi:hypothetical protein